MALQEQKQDDDLKERIAKLERDNLILMDSSMFAITSLLILSLFGKKMFGPFVLYMYVFNGFTLSGFSDKLFKKNDWCLYFLPCACSLGCMCEGEEERSFF